MSAQSYGREEARELLQEELSRPKYQAEGEGLFGRLGQLFSDLWNDLLDRIFALDHPWLLAILALVVIGLLIWLFIVIGRPRRPQLDLPERAAFEPEDTRTAAQLQAAAEAAAARGDWLPATQDMFRSGVMAAVESRRVTVQDGNTAHELGARIARLHPGAESRDAGEVFDRITFGGQAATADSYRVMQAFAAACHHLRPDAAGPAEAEWARPV